MLLFPEFDSSFTAYDKSTSTYFSPSRKDSSAVQQEPDHRDNEPILRTEATTDLDDVFAEFADIDEDHEQSSERRQNDENMGVGESDKDELSDSDASRRFTVADIIAEHGLGSAQYELDVVLDKSDVCCPGILLLR